MTKDEALKRGMELLRSNISAQQWFELQPEINTIKEALAQPEQELWCVEMNGCKTKCADCPDEPEQPQEEPVAIVIKSGVNRTWMSEALGQLPDGTYSLYTTPPKREWVGLTDMQIKNLWIQYRAALPRYLCFARAIEAAHDMEECESITHHDCDCRPLVYGDTAPPKREWVGLTDDDLVACSEAQKATVIYFLAKLKKLNT